MTTEKTKTPRIKSIAAPTGTFVVEVNVSDLNGNAGVIGFDCISRTQTAWSRERGELFAQATARQKEREAKAAKAADVVAADDAPAPEPEFDPTQLEKMFIERIAGDAEMVLKIAKGWDLEDDFNQERIAAMEDAYPGAISELMSEYSKKIHGARTGN